MESKLDIFEDTIQKFISETSKKTEESSTSKTAFKKKISWLLGQLSLESNSDYHLTLRSFLNIIRSKILAYLMKKYGNNKLKSIYNRVTLHDIKKVKVEVQEK